LPLLQNKQQPQPVQDVFTKYVSGKCKEVGEKDIYERKSVLEVENELLSIATVTVTKL
jgi:hypothetical protein